MYLSSERRVEPSFEKQVKTPLETCTQTVVEDDSIVIVPILRAGLGMVDGFLALVPSAKVGLVGLYRDEETHEPREYYCKLPENIQEKTCVVIDPMLATGGSAVAAIDLLKRHGCTKFKLMNI